GGNEYDAVSFCNLLSWICTHPTNRANADGSWGETVWNCHAVIKRYDAERYLSFVEADLAQHSPPGSTPSKRNTIVADLNEGKRHFHAGDYDLSLQAYEAAIASALSVNDDWLEWLALSGAISSSRRLYSPSTSYNESDDAHVAKRSDWERRVNALENKGDVRRWIRRLADRPERLSKETLVERQSMERYAAFGGRRIAYSSTGYFVWRALQDLEAFGAPPDMVHQQCSSAVE